MGNQRSYYALIQYSPQPERMEFVNVGVVLVVPELCYLGVRFSESAFRVEKLFGRQPRPYLDALKASLSSRLHVDFARNPDIRAFEEFAEKRANEMRLSRPMPMAADDPEQALAELFESLVGEDKPRSREPRIARRLREEFEKAGVVHYLEARPEVDLPEYGIKVSTPYGYQNGVYNLVDAMRLPKSVHEGMREAGKRAMEGNLVWRHFQQGGEPKRLIVVGDFREQTNEFYHAVAEQMEQAEVKLHRLDDMRLLLRDIEANGKLHA